MVDKLSDNLNKFDKDIDDKCICLPLSAMKKLFGLTCNEILASPELNLVSQRYCAFGEDAINIDSQLIEQALKLSNQDQDSKKTPKKTTLFFCHSPQQNREPSVDKTSKQVDGIDIELINEIFHLEDGMIIDIKKGLCESIELVTPSLSVAQNLEKIISSRMENGSQKYGGLIRAGGVIGKDSLLEISFRALEDFENLLQVEKKKML